MGAEHLDTDGAPPDAESGPGAETEPDAETVCYGEDRTNVAIACQGGGSHTAFTAGVLTHLLENWNPDHRLVGLSGTSGGAFTACGAWYGLISPDENPIDIIDGIWSDMAAEDPTDRWMNTLTVWWSRVQASGFPTPEVSPYDTPATRLGKQKLADTLTDHIDFDRLCSLVTEETPELVVGTVDINGGIFETFVNDDLSVDAVLASAAVPDLFEAVEIHGHYHWDGLFSQNPPINDLMSVDPARKPDELWVIQINPQEREGEPRTMAEISDRRNELSGNISMNQELGFIETVNEWVEAGHLPDSEFSHTTVHRIELDGDLHCSTKVDRSPSFIAELRELGAQRAAAFLAERA